MCPVFGSSKPPIMRRVVVFPQPEGPSSAKKRPWSTCSERLSTATTSSKRFVTSTRRTSGAVDSVIAVAPGKRARAPVVHLLPELEVEEALRRQHPVDGADAVRQLEQVPP